MNPFTGIRKLTVGLALAMATGMTTQAQEATATTAESMRKAATNLLNALDDDLKAKATFAWDSDERLNWHFIPRERLGLPLDAMGDGQRALAHALIQSGLSYQGYAKALTIMHLEDILAQIENNPVRRDSGKYFVSIFGTPTKDATWGWRVEGHHLAMNFTIVKGKHVAGTPSFMATNPGRVLEGPEKGLQVLAAEENLARKFVNSLTDKQAKAAIFSDKAPRDIITAAEKQVTPLDKVGVSYKDLSSAQQAELMKLIKLYVGRNRPTLAKADLAKAEAAGLENILFAWAGGTKKGEGHYYRIQGPTFLLEYANTQNDANHVHAVYRDYKDDFGYDLLRQHYATHHRE